MKITLYVARTVISAIVLVSIIFFGLLLFVSLLSEIGATGRGDYGFIQAFFYVLCTMPLLTYQIFPTIILIGVLIGLGTLASHSELTIMRTSGLSLFKISSMVVGSAIVVIVMISLIGEGFAPNLARYAQNFKTLEQNHGQVISTLSGVWLRTENNFYHIVRVDSNEEVHGVTRYHFSPQHQLISSSQAKSGKKENGEWTFYDVTTAHIHSSHVDQTHSDSVNWPIIFNFHQFMQFDPTQASLDSLHKQIDYGLISGTNVGSYEITFWSRIFQPLTTLIMVFVAIPFIFGPLRSVSIGLRLLSGITVGLVFFILNRFLVSFGLAYQVPPLIAALTLPILFFGFALFLFWWKR